MHVKWLPEVVNHWCRRCLLLNKEIWRVNCKITILSSSPDLISRALRSGCLLILTRFSSIKHNKKWQCQNCQCQWLLNEHAFAYRWDAVLKSPRERVQYHPLQKYSDQQIFDNQYSVSESSFCKQLVFSAQHSVSSIIPLRRALTSTEKWYSAFSILTWKYFQFFSIT